MKTICTSDNFNCINREIIAPMMDTTHGIILTVIIVTIIATTIWRILK